MFKIYLIKEIKMKIAVAGSRTVREIGLDEVIPKYCTEIVSGGARGVDSEAAAWARSHDIPLVEFLPDYKRYGRAAPIKRNEAIAKYADELIAFWDGQSKGTESTINFFKKAGKKVTIFIR